MGTVARGARAGGDLTGAAGGGSAAGPARAGGEILLSDGCRPLDWPLRWALAGAAAFVVAVTAVRFAGAVSDWSHLNHVSGVWTALAHDLNEGVFYRPLSDAGDLYGGTRYMPLHFVLHAALMRLGLAPAAAGYVLTALAAVLLSCGVYSLLRAFRVERVFAGAAAVLWLSTAAGQYAVLTVRGDLLAAALVVWGLALAARLLSGGRGADAGGSLGPVDGGREDDPRGDGGREDDPRGDGGREDDPRGGEDGLPLPGLGGGRSEARGRQGRGALSSTQAGGAAGAPVWTGSGALVAAAVVFTLGLAARVTAVAGVGAAVGALFFAGRRRRGWRLGAATLVLFAAAVAAIELFSRGAWLSSMRASSLGDVPAAAVLVGPYRLLYAAAHHDPFALVLWVMAAGTVAVGGRVALVRLETLSFLSAAVVFSLVFAARGVEVNNLLDLDVLAVVVVAAGIRRSRGEGAFAVACIVAVAVVGAGLPFVRDLVIGSSGRRAAVVSLAEEVRASAGPVLSEDPFVEVLAGRRATVLDPFSFRRAVDTRADVAEEFLGRIRGRRFAAVVVMYARERKGGQTVYGHPQHFCDGFGDAIAENYVQAGTYGPYRLLLPRE